MLEYDKISNLILLNGYEPVIGYTFLKGTCCITEMPLDGGKGLDF